MLSPPPPSNELLPTISILTDGQRVALDEFVQNNFSYLASGVLLPAMEPIDAFLGRREDRWASHDHEVDAKWDQFVKDILVLGAGKILEEDLVKPSGPLRVGLMSLWHYPTFKTQRKRYGMTHDKANPSIRMHNKKIGNSGFIRTQDRIVIRHKFVSAKDGGVAWGTKIPNWEQVMARSDAFNKDLIKSARVVVMVGKDNCRSWRQLFDLEEEDRVEEILFHKTIDRKKLTIR